MVNANTQDLRATAKALVADGKGILAADETVGTLTGRFEKLKIPSTPETRRDYREMLFTAPGSAEFISGVILYDETIRQRGSNGAPLPDVLLKQNIIPGIKVDIGAKLLASSEGETVTEGLDGLRERLKDYRALGARFAKWRAVIRIGDSLPTTMCISVNAHALARYAALCQEQAIVPIVEPEVLMEGKHAIDRCAEVTGRVLHSVFDALYEHQVLLEGMLLKPNMIVPGTMCAKQNAVPEVAEATLRCLFGHVPPAVPGIVFLSGGQTDVLATKHLNEINARMAGAPWKISFSYGRALQDMALATWFGEKKNAKAAQQAYCHRAKCNAAASRGMYTELLEQEFKNTIPTASDLGVQDD